MKKIFFTNTVLLMVLGVISAFARENSISPRSKSDESRLKFAEGNSGLEVGSPALFKDNFDFEDADEGNPENFKCYGVLMASTVVSANSPKSLPNSAVVTVDFDPSKEGWGILMMSNDFVDGPKDFTYATMKVSMKVVKNRNATIMDNLDIVLDDVDGFVSFWLKDEDGTTAVMSKPYRFKPSRNYKEFTTKVRNVDQVSAEVPTADKDLDLNNIVAVGVCIFRDNNGRLNNLLDFYIDDFIVEKDFVE